MAKLMKEISQTLIPPAKTSHPVSVQKEIQLGVLYIFEKLFLFYAYSCLACTFVCIPLASLMPKKPKVQPKKLDPLGTGVR